MEDEVKVTVLRYPDRENLVMAYTCPLSGKRKTKSAGTANEGDAWKEAAAWEAELRSGGAAAPSKVTWQQFRERYFAEHVASLAPKTAESARGAFAHIERQLNPDRLAKLNASALSTLQSKLRGTGIEETTIASVLLTVRAALGWAVSVGMLREVPKVVMPKRAKGKAMKGGPLLGEQFDVLLMAVPKIRPHDAPAWVYFLRGVLLSGLRLQEAVGLSWDASAPFSIDLSGKRPRFRIKGEAQKSGKDELLPMVPEAAAFFLDTPPEQRHGRVFRLDATGTGVPLDHHHVGKVVSDMGRRARVIVDPTEGKTATLHDLRRTFASKWARRVAPAVLQRLMRHASIATTMGYYVDLDVDEMADELWADHPAGESRGESNSLGNIGPFPAGNEGSPKVTTDYLALPYISEGDGARTRNHRIDSPVL